MSQEDYKVRLDVFEGPLDLLLYLIRRDELDIYDIPIEMVTKQYMKYLELMRMLDLNIAGDFIVMAATLMMIKSRMLLPVEERNSEQTEEDDEDPRWDLVRQLVEYKKFKDAALHLEEQESLFQDVFSREAEYVEMGAKEVRLDDVGIFDLITAFQEALSNVKEEELREIFAERVTVPEKIEAILSRLRKKDHIKFNELFSGMSTRHEIVCTFLALLELIRLQHARAEQRGIFGEIVISAAQE